MDPTQRPQSRLLSLPVEVIVHTASQAEQASRAALAPTCRAMSDLVTPVLYSHPALTFRWPILRPNGVDVAAVEAFFRTLDSFPDRKGMIRSLVMPFGRYAEPDPSSQGTAYDRWLDILASESHRYSRLADLEIWTVDRAPPAETFARCLQHLPLLRRLSVDGTPPRDGRIDAQLPCLPNIGDLALPSAEPSFGTATPRSVVQDVVVMLPNVAKALLSISFGEIDPPSTSTSTLQR